MADHGEVGRYAIVHPSQPFDLLGGYTAAYTITGIASIILTFITAYALGFKSYGPPPFVDGITDSDARFPESYVWLRGNPDARGPTVDPGFLSALGGGDAVELFWAREVLRRPVAGLGPSFSWARD